MKPKSIKIKATLQSNLKMAVAPATRKFLNRNKANPQPRQFQRQPQFQQPQHINMFQKGDQAEPLSSSMDLLFGGEGERLVGNTQAIFPQLNTSDVGDIVSSVQDELGIFSQSPQQTQRRIPRRRR